MTHFKSGDLVVLKSGGPTMTVDTVNTDIFDDDKITGVLCVWFVGDMMQRVRFDHRAIKLCAPLQQAEAPPLEATRIAGMADVAAQPAPSSLHPTPSCNDTPHVADPEAAAGVARDGASEIAISPQPVAVSETGGDYAEVLDSMVGAMNATAELMAPAPRPARRAKANVRTVRGKDTTTH